MVPASGSVPAGCGVGLFPSWMGGICSQTVEPIFSVRFWPFPVVSARFGVLSAPLNSTVSVYSEAVCGQTCGQKALLDQVRHPLPPPVQKGSFSYSGFGYCTSGDSELQRFSLPLSAPSQPPFHAERKGHFQGQNCPKLASLYQRIGRRNFTSTGW